MEAMTLLVKLKTDSSDFEGDLKNAETKAKTFGSKLGGALSTAGKVGAVAIGAVGTAAAVTGKALWNGAKEVAEYGDNVDKMSQKIGISAEAYQEWDAVFQHSGANVNSLQQGMKSLNNQLNKVTDATKLASSPLSKLGLTMDEVGEMAKNPDKALETVISKLQELPAGAERSALATQLLGRSGVELGALLNTSAEETQKMRDRVHELGGVMSDEAVKASAKFQDNMQDLKTALQGVKRSIINDTLPAFNELIDGFTKLIAGEEGADEAIEAGIEKMGQAIDKIIPRIGTILEKLLPAIIDIGAKAMGSLAKQVPKIITAIGKQLPNVMKGLLDVIKQLIPEIGKLAGDLMESLAEGMGDGSGVINTLVDILDTLLQTIATNLPRIVQAGIQIIGKLAFGLVNALPDIVDAVLNAIQTFITTIVQNLPQIIRQGKDILLALIRGITQSIPKIVNSIVDVVMAIVDTIIDNLPDILEAGVELIVELARGLVEAIPQLVEKIPEIITGIVEALLSPESIGRILQAGLDMIGKLFEGILNGDFVGMAVDLIASLGKAILGALGSLLSIGGKIIGAIWDGMKSAWQAVDNWLSEVVYGTINGAVGEANKMGAAVGAAGLVGQNNGNKSGYSKSDAVSSGNSMADRYRTQNNVYVGNKKVASVNSSSQTQSDKRSSGR